jgi:hypothetical protein
MKYKIILHIATLVPSSVICYKLQIEAPSVHYNNYTFDFYRGIVIDFSKGK